MPKREKTLADERKIPLKWNSLSKAAFDLWMKLEEKENSKSRNPRKKLVKVEFTFESNIQSPDEIGEKGK